jgi:hypothetical protein
MRVLTQLNFQWAHYEGHISEWQAKSQEELGKRVRDMVEYPVSSRHGIFGLLEGGDYCRNNQKQDTNDLEKKMARILTIRFASQILRAKVSFVYEIKLGTFYSRSHLLCQKCRKDLLPLG